MTNEEALKEFVKFVQLKTTQHPAFLSNAVEALAKQIPKRPNNIVYEVTGSFEGTFAQFDCPSCRTEVNHLQNYCPECGQALDWEDGNAVRNS